MTLNEAKLAISIGGSCVDYHYKYDPPGTWRWMKVKSLSDDETTLYFIPNGSGVYCSAPLEDIIVDKMG